MKKLIVKIFIFAIIISVLNIPTALASFSDLAETHKNYVAIIYLQNHGIISGYPDGTFKPNNSVNRAEFLKIILNGSNVALNINQTTPFPDVNHGAWYAPYLKKAYSEGWINGYPDGTFKPEQTINKVEALKVLAKVQNWQLENYANTRPFNDTESGQWYTPYVAYAKDHQYLEETGVLFFPAMLMTRAKISEIIYRSLTVVEVVEVIEVVEEPEDDNVSLEEEIPSEENIDFTPENFDTISTTFYNNITLDETLPNTFYKNEVYNISGAINSGAYETVTVILDGTSQSYYDTFAAEVENSRFSIPVHFSTTGNYNLGILPGDSGQTSAKAISVLASLPEDTNLNTNPSKATNLAIHFANDRTYMDFSAPSSYLKKITLTQGNNTVNYYSRQNISSAEVTYSDFKNFSEGTVSYNISTASLSSQKPLQISSNFISGSTKNFQATTHSFSTTNKEGINTNPPDTLTNLSAISFTGTFNVDGEQTAYVIKPDGFVEDSELTTTAATSTYLSKTIINDGGNFTFSYTPSVTGRYIVEINDKNGEPILNHPIYIGSIIPLIPDFFDLNEREFFDKTFNLTNARQELLDLINEDRISHGLGTVTMADDLNSISQAHSEDMRTNNFFSHVNLAGKTPENRRLDAGITTSVGENIAKDTSIEFGHYGLMRSAAHRENILTADWTRVGLGIALSNDGYLYIVQEFSTSEITAEDLINYKSELYTRINNKRSQNGLSTLTVTTPLESTGNYLNNKVINEGATLTNALFTEALNANSIIGQAEAIGRTFNIWADMLSSILDSEPGIIESGWQNIGANLQLDAEGSIHTILVINDPN